MKFPPKECPSCGCTYWARRSDVSPGVNTHVWKAADHEWHHGPESEVIIMMCPACNFTFSYTTKKGEVPITNFLEKLALSYKRYLHPGIVGRFFSSLPATIIFREAQVNQRVGYMDVTFRFILTEQQEPASEGEATPNT